MDTKVDTRLLPLGLIRSWSWHCGRRKLMMTMTMETIQSQMVTIMEKPKEGKGMGGAGLESLYLDVRGQPS